MNREPSIAVQAPVRWPEIQPGWRSRVNRWVMAYPQLRFRVGDRDCGLSWTPPRAQQLPLRIQLQCAGHDFCVRLSGLEAVDPRLVGEPFAGMPRSLKIMVVERVIVELAAILPLDLSHTLNVVGISWLGEDLGHEPAGAKTSSTPEISFELRNHSLQGISSGRFEFADPGALDWILDRFPQKPVRNIDASGLRVRGWLALGYSDVTLEDIQRLEPGGFAWICSGSINAEGICVQMRLDGDSTAYRLAVKQRRATVVGAQGIAEAVLPGGETPSSPNAKDQTMNADTSKLQLRLQFDLGEVMLSVEEIEKLGPDYVFELPQEIADAEVSIRVHGQCIATGEIMAVGRRLGVRITRLVAPPPGEGNARTLASPDTEAHAS